jgi:RNA polymerase sigma factor (TIGR02999 family)
MAEVTAILSAIEQGDARASAQLLPIVYEELRRLARLRLEQEPPGQTLQATALVHEAYLRLVGTYLGDSGVAWDSQAHFFAAAAEAMRRILIDNARRKQRLKHGGASQRVELNEADLAIESPSDDLLSLNEALDKLAREKPAQADLVKLRYFAGLKLEEAGRMLGLSPATADRYWAFARAWLYRELGR